jgi:hypothetical protein
MSACQPTSITVVVSNLLQTPGLGRQQGSPRLSHFPASSCFVPISLYPHLTSAPWWQTLASDRYSCISSFFQVVLFRRLVIQIKSTVCREFEWWCSALLCLGEGPKSRLENTTTHPCCHDVTFDVISTAHCPGRVSVACYSNGLRRPVKRQI